jgi:hypothetical protein
VSIGTSIAIGTSIVIGTSPIGIASGNEPSPVTVHASVVQAASGAPMTVRPHAAVEPIAITKAKKKGARMVGAGVWKRGVGGVKPNSCAGPNGGTLRFVPIGNRIHSAVFGAALIAASFVCVPTAHAQRLSAREINQLATLHFRLGSDQFRAGHYAEAAREFQTVYDLTPQPEMLFNLARAYDAAGQYDRAIAAYEEFLARGAPNFGADQVREWINALRARRDAAGGAVTPPTDANGNATTCAPTSAEPTSHAPVAAPMLLRPRTVRVEFHRSALDEYGPFILGAVGLVAAGIGGWQGLLYLRDRDLYAQANRGDITWGRDVQSAFDNAPGEGIAGIALAASGGALVLTSIVWLIARGPGHRRELLEAFATPSNGSHAPMVFGLRGTL